jgi:hypothetical protein
LSRFTGVKLTLSEAKGKLGARRRNPEPRSLRRRIWLRNSTAECWSEKPVDTVQFRAEPPTFGEWPSWFKARALGARDREFESPLPDQIIFHKEIIVADELISS